MRRRFLRKLPGKSMGRKGKFICKSTCCITTSFETMHKHLPANL